MMVYIGLSFYYAKRQDIDQVFPFEDAKANFYRCAQHGLHTNIRWFNKNISVQKLVLEELIPKAAQALIEVGVAEDQVQYYLQEVLYQRTLSGQTGACWQRAFVNCYGKDFQSLTESYFKNQETHKPVHSWSV